MDWPLVAFVTAIGIIAALYAVGRVLGRFNERE